MRTAIFLQGSDDKFLQALGVPYGQIVIVGYAHVEVITVSDARPLLRELVERQIISADTAADLERQVIAAGVLADMGAIFALAKRHPMPKDLVRVLQFDATCPDTPLFAAAMPQGRMMSSTGHAFSGTIRTLTDGFTMCRSLGMSGIVRMFDICMLMREMQAANLPWNDVDRKERFDKLPADRRKAIEAEARAVQVRLTSEFFQSHPLLTTLFGGVSTDE